MYGEQPDQYYRAMCLYSSYNCYASCICLSQSRWGHHLNCIFQAEFGVWDQIIKGDSGLRANRCIFCFNTLAPDIRNKFFPTSFPILRDIETRICNQCLSLDCVHSKHLNIFSTNLHYIRRKPCTQYYCRWSLLPALLFTYNKHQAKESPLMQITQK